MSLYDLYGLLLCEPCAFFANFAVKLRQGFHNTTQMTLHPLYGSKNLQSKTSMTYMFQI
ncbi:hypothetical protein FLAVO9R_110237 [Flavobacterium sp. 9R]|nr:hypothetical protein FLAVO9R_110237 [Flavobacterium sp. 9R]